MTRKIQIILFGLFLLSCIGILAMEAPVNSICMDEISLSGESDSGPLRPKPALSGVNNFWDLHLNQSGNNVPITPITNKYRSDKKEYRFVMKDRLYHRIWVSDPVRAGIERERAPLFVEQPACVQTCEIILTEKMRE